jgi:hypothetical protein
VLTAVAVVEPAVAAGSTVVAAAGTIAGGGRSQAGRAIKTTAGMPRKKRGKIIVIRSEQW